MAEAALASSRDTPLIIYLPRRLTRTELRFCDGIAARGLLHVVVAVTGEQAADRDALAIRDALDPVPATAAPPFPARARAQTRALPDAEEEARYAVRRIFAQLEREPGTCLDRIAIAYRAAAPYARLVSEQLSAADIPHHAPRQRSLACTAIRTGIGLRTLSDRRAAERRDHLAALVSAPVVVLTHPVADSRAQRVAEPAPWLLEQTDPRLTSREEKQQAPASFQASVCDAGLPAASASEYDVRLAVLAAPLSKDHPLAAAVPALARGLTAAQQRSGGVFGPWTGGLTHPVPEAVTARFTGFVSWAREQIDGAADAIETITPERDDDAAQILTIHSSKGLEFPIVALAGINTPPLTRRQVIWPADGPPEITLHNKFSTAGFAAAQHAEKVLDQQEQLRLLYVGMTRAADHLMISLYHHPPRHGRPDTHAMRLSRMLPALREAGAACEPAAPAVPARLPEPAAAAAGVPAGTRRQFLTSARNC